MKTGTWTYENGTLSMADQDGRYVNYRPGPVAWGLQSWLDYPSQESGRRDRAESVQRVLETWTDGTISRGGFKCWLDLLPNAAAAACRPLGFVPTTEIRTSGYTFEAMGDRFRFSRAVEVEDLREDEDFLRWLSAHLE